ncbi:kinesin-like protein KIN-12E [Bidens hawaiensis]|uniref:kinesin-like protein KIN-12E n=1 Tax=Bidens hawaiensis TaxID=980011 RepID=UPI00404A41BD
MTPFARECNLPRKYGNQVNQTHFYHNQNQNQQNYQQRNQQMNQNPYPQNRQQQTRQQPGNNQLQLQTNQNRGNARGNHQGRDQGDVVVTMVPQDGEFDWSNHAAKIEKANISYMAKINETGETSNSEGPSEHTTDLLLIIDDLNREVRKWKSECGKKDVVINVYDDSERTYENQIKSLEEDCMKSYRIQSKLNLEVDGNIMGHVEKMKPIEKYKIVPPPFCDKYPLKVDNEQREEYLKQFKSTFEDKKEFISMYENVTVNKKREFDIKENITPADKGVEKKAEQKNAETRNESSSEYISCSCNNRGLKVFSNHEHFDVGGPKYAPRRRTNSERDERSTSPQVKLKEVKFVKAKEQPKIDVCGPIQVDYDKCTYAQKSLGLEVLKPSERYINDKALEELGSLGKTRFGYSEHNRSSESSLSVIKETPFSFRDRDRGGEYSSSSSSSVAVNLNDSFEFREDPAFWKDHNVQVIIRVRPLSTSEIAVQGPSRCVKQASSQTITWIGPPEARFTFDHVADEHVTQEMLFKVAGVPMVENCMGGYNSCMFAYGQTGSGKTHTMLGDIDGGSRRHSVNSGMTPRVFEYLFTRIQKEREARREEKIQYTCKCSFLEIYNEQILDLLDPSSTNLQIREDTKKGIYVDNLKEIEVTSARDVIQQLIQGAANRKVASTNMNRASSRSHSVFTCIIESKWVSQGVTHHRFARLNLVDLAGSERQKSSGAEGERLKEATNINKSLSTLGLVIMNLVSVSNGKSPHVPYRDSKLTFLLQDSLGGNSKTTIIANISPSTCNSLETLSTLKFAQRAKFIKNHATVNEDASGDVLAMRTQIQNLKNEVSRLQNVINGGTENNGDDTWTVSFPGSPGSFKWEGIQGSFSPVTAVKRISNKKEYEVALVGAFRRVKDKDIRLQALTAESQAALQLAKQREDEIQGLKMRLRFRAAAIKRLEGVASGKISAETHLLKEKEEHLKELDVLRSQADRNQEVTRFAMENLRLKEEIRRLKSFYEEGEQERMNEQIMILENKLLDALDWKLMHETQPTPAKKSSFDFMLDSKRDGDFFSLKEPVTPQKTQFEFPLITTPNVTHVATPNVTHVSDQRELQTMVDAIAAASQREAEAHETAIILSKENDELKAKLKMLIDDNNKLIELYDHAVADSQQNINRIEESHNNHADQTELAQKDTELRRLNEKLEQQLVEMHEENDKLLGLYEKALQESQQNNVDQKEVELRRLNEKLTEMHEENDRLLGLYEKAMREKGQQNRADQAEFGQKEVELRRLNENLEHQLTELHEENERLLGMYENAMQERDELKRLFSSIDQKSQSTQVKEGSEAQVNGLIDDNLVEVSVNDDPDVQMVEKSTYCDEQNQVDFVSANKNLQEKLDNVHKLLSKSSENVGLFTSLEREIIDIDRLSRTLQKVKVDVLVKQKHHKSTNVAISHIKERENTLQRKMTAVKQSMSNFSKSLCYFEQREAQSRAKAHAASSHLQSKKNELIRVLTVKEENERAMSKIKQSESELKNHIATLKVKIEEEINKRENDKVLLAIDNVKWELGKATELLKSEEEKRQLQSEMKQDQEKLVTVKSEYERIMKMSHDLDKKQKAVELEIQKLSNLTEETEIKLQSSIEEKQMLLEMKESGTTEFENLFLEFQETMFVGKLRDEESMILSEEVEMGVKRLEDLEVERSVCVQKVSDMVEETRGDWLFEKIVEELESICSSCLN